MKHEPQRFLAILLAAAFSGCGEEPKDDPEKLRLKEQIQHMELQLARVRADKTALNADLDRLKGELRDALSAEAVAAESLAAARAEKVKIATRLTEALESARSSESYARSSEKNASELRSMQRRMRMLEDEIKTLQAERQALQTKVATLEKGSRDALALMVEKDQKLADALARVKVLESRDTTAEMQSRLARGKKTALTPGTPHAVAFEAREGETLRWIWAIVKGPEDLTSESIEFHITGPDKVRIYSTRAGLEKRGDDGGVRVGAEGQWTIDWVNKHASGEVLIQYAVYVIPVKK